MFIYFYILYTDELYPRQPLDFARYSQNARTILIWKHIFEKKTMQKITVIELSRGRNTTRF